MNTLKDSFGRSFPYIRLSITDVCNFKCGYCLPNGYQNDKSDNRTFIKKEEIDDQFYEDLVKDIETLEDLKKTWEEKINQNFKDPKFERFHNKLKEELSRKDKRKVLIFSEFADILIFV